MGASTLVGHSSLITKVYFPRELLPLSMTAANLVNLLHRVRDLPAVRDLGPRVLAPGLIVLLIPITFVLFVFTSALAMLLSARWCTFATSSS